MIEFGIWVPRFVIFFRSYCRYTSRNTLSASDNRLPPAEGRIGEMVTTHLSFVTEAGDISTSPSVYLVPVHVDGGVNTYSLSVAMPVALDCECCPAPLAVPGFAAFEASEEDPRAGVAFLSMASSAGRFLLVRSGRVASTNAAI